VAVLCGNFGVPWLRLKARMTGGLFCYLRAVAANIGISDV
jgi:hypothetical protein